MCILAIVALVAIYVMLPLIMYLVKLHIVTCRIVYNSGKLMSRKPYKFSHISLAIQVRYSCFTAAHTNSQHVNNGFLTLHSHTAA